MCALWTHALFKFFNKMLEDRWEYNSPHNDGESLFPQTVLYHVRVPGMTPFIVAQLTMPIVMGCVESCPRALGKALFSIPSFHQ